LKDVEMIYDRFENWSGKKAEKFLQ
jgi:hypothetical protein